MSSTTGLVGVMMKTINTKKSGNKDEVLTNKNTDIQYGFAGMAKIYDSEVYIDTRDGTGYDKAIVKFKPLINRLSKKYNFRGNTIEDTKHDIIIHILEGIQDYNPEKNMKLSTFIEMRASKRIINSVRKQCQLSNNATFVNLGLYNVICDCGYTFRAKIVEVDNITCPSCGNEINSNNFRFVGFGESQENDRKHEADIRVFNEVGKSIDEEVIFNHDMSNALKNEDIETKSLVGYIYHEGLSITGAAQKSNILPASANKKLKRLGEKDKIQKVFGK